MRIRLLALLLPLLLLALADTRLALGSGPAQAAHDNTCPVVNDRSASCRYARGLLWKLEKSGRQPSYLFGTIHTSDPRIVELPPVVRDTLAGARSFTMEVVLNGVDELEAAALMFFSDGRSLTRAIGQERFDRVAQALHAHTGADMPLFGLNTLKPWAVVVMLSMPPGMNPDNILDRVLEKAARTHELPVYGLETAREQVSIFDTLTLEDQSSLLDDALGHQPRLNDIHEQLYTAYLQRDLAAVHRLVDEMNPSDPVLARRLHRALIADRNARMLKRLQPRLKEGRAFIAVGAAHLPGDDGLLALLERAGWRVSAVY